jgi:hypothetical protein
LYLTDSKKWVINKFSDYQGNADTYEIVDADQAVRWFLKQEMELPEILAGLDKDYEI